MKACEMMVRLIALVVLAACLLGVGSGSAHAQIYLSDPNIANFTPPSTTYATLSNYASTEGCTSPSFTPTATELATPGCRVFGGTLTGNGLSTANNWIEATFSTPVSTIVVFPNIDHFGSAYDGYQYTIAGSTDGANWKVLFDATSVSACVSNCNASVPSEPFTLGSFTGTAPLFVNNVLTPQSPGLDAGCSGTSTPCAIGYIAFFDFGTAYKYYAFGASTVAAGNNPSPNTDQELSAVGTGPAAITHTLVGNGVTNTFTFFPNLTYNVIYPADVSIAANTTMTISPNVLALLDCTSAINIPAFSSGEPTCTTYTAVNGFSAIFDVACSVNGAVSTSQQCPKTTGFDPFVSSGIHSAEDISNILVYQSGDNTTGKAPQMLTAPEGSNAWVPYEVGFNLDCCTRGSGGSSYNSTVVAADFPSATSAFALPAYTFPSTGFFQPPVSNSEQNIVKAGRTIPLKWCISYPVAPSLGFNGGPITNLTFPPNGYLSISAAQISTSSISALPDNLIDTQTNAGLLNLGGGCYNFGWATSRAFAGQSFIVTVEAGDGQKHTANFTFF
jgi:hypothetical protein